MFSRRTSWDLRPNRLTSLLRDKRRAGTTILDLTETNPTCVGIPYPSDLLDLLADPAGLRYEPAATGLHAARGAIARDYARKGLGVEAWQVVLTSSTSEAYALLFKLLCDPGDAILVPQPSYPLFDHLAGLESALALPYPLLYDGEWHVSLAVKPQAIDARTRALVVVNPNNPTGSFLKRDEAAALVALCLEKELALIADEVFADYAFAADPRRAGSLACEERVLSFSLGGLSKSCGLPQLKLGWIVVSGPEERRREALARLEMVADTYLSVNTPVQLAAPTILARKDELQRPITRRIATNVSTLHEKLERAEAVTLLPPEGGWSAVLRVPATVPEEERVLSLLNEDDVLCHPGFFFDFPNEAFLIVSLLAAPEHFAEGIDRILRRVEA